MPGEVRSTLGTVYTWSTDCVQDCVQTVYTFDAQTNYVMASLLNRNGTYYAQFYDAHRTPKKKRLSLRTKRKREARKRLVQLERDWERGTFDPWSDDPRTYKQEHIQQRDLTLRENGHGPAGRAADVVGPERRTLLAASARPDERDTPRQSDRAEGEPPTEERAAGWILHATCWASSYQVVVPDVSDEHTTPARI